MESVESVGSLKPPCTWPTRSSILGFGPISSSSFKRSLGESLRTALIAKECVILGTS